MELEVSTILNTSPPVTSDGRLRIPRWAAALCPHPEQPQLLHLKVPDLGATLQRCSGSGHNLVSVTLTGVRCLSAAEFQSAVTAAYLTVLSTLSNTHSPHPIRMWNFIGDIHRPMGPGVDRYRVFNSGRFEAFSQLAGSPGINCERTFVRQLPAATGVGETADEVVIHALGARSPGAAIENPLQVPAFAYSTAHGPRPPCFSRAVIAELEPLNRTTNSRPTLLFSGTASIRGENSTHASDLPAQFDETIRNIEHLAQSVKHPCRFAISGLETARIYYPRSADEQWLRRAARDRLGPSTFIELLPAAICRAELLIEIEGTIAATSPRQPTQGPAT